MASSVVRLPALTYAHILDTNRGVTSLVVGPRVVTLSQEQKVVSDVTSCVLILQNHYCIIRNPVLRGDDKAPLFDEHGNVKLAHGDEEIRFSEHNGGEPFPLYPGERLLQQPTAQTVLTADQALHLRVLRSHRTEAGQIREAGEEYLCRGPCTYRPRVEEQVVEVVPATIIRPNEALLLRAVKQTTDSQGNARKTGEQWLVRAVGSYMRDVDEAFVRTVRALPVTRRVAVHLRATRTFEDVYGTRRKAGEEWLVTHDMSDSHIPDVYEEVVKNVPITVLNSRQYCFVTDPVGGDGKQAFGRREVRKGECSFFLQPGERLAGGVQSVHVLAEGEALLLRATEEFDDGGVHRSPGDRWMIHGPADFIPATEVEILEPRRRMALDVNEGVYVRDVRSGGVRAVVGESYMLSANEELWHKDLPDIVEQLLGIANRDKSRVVTYRAPHNSCVQVYDYKEKRSRIAFGPALVMLGPDEHFTVLSLSGGKPKQPHKIKALELRLGPDFMTDIVTVETMDHANLSLRLSYNWKFNTENSQEGKLLFQVPDFVGDACKAIASRVRGAVAAAPFDHFHKNSARLIREAVFGLDEKGSINNRFFFPANQLEITNIDIQAVEPVDQRTRDSLQKSVQLAIEITTKSQEATARHRAERQEQEAKGELERQKIIDDVKIEEKRKELIAMTIESAHIEAAGQSTAAAKAKAAVASIEGTSAVKQAELLAEASQLEADCDLELVGKKQRINIEFRQQLTELEIVKSQELAAIEAEKFRGIVDAIGADTIRAIAQAGPELQAKLLNGLGLKSFLITDGHSPVNLLSSAQGLIGQQ
mmetsp:Transcript_22062/g.62029  ORF Transcript_22062/g.62029 Transcript_22062/m.62029 type:complete len:818 (-) Transcript_22062:67-2520(-)|eukprot:CAMPEP_0119126324 /NCGR_PEP_ID=MMETSP1310-20130426/5294_1 /TAXON_ID=464262 /ORGANISM="Genus nov. species nov., Strain RCC2339" /LENGTH=817 /DNA_ID=CAMNT_0007116477 /DNA_START=70 /DNA_END=2523 /DNA_ORIENTATION=-